MTTKAHPLSGAPHSHAVGDTVWVHIRQFEYSGTVIPAYDGWVTIHELARSRIHDVPIYRGTKSNGGPAVFGDYAVRADPPEPTVTLKDEADTIADFLALEAVENPIAEKWVALLRRYAHE